MRVASIGIAVGIVAGAGGWLGGCGAAPSQPMELVDTTPVTIDTREATSKGRLCTILVRCGMVDDMATCGRQELGLRVSADLVAAVRAGKVIFHGDDARACLDGDLPSGCDDSRLFSARAIAEMRYAVRGCGATGWSMLVPGGVHVRRVRPVGRAPRIRAAYPSDRQESRFDNSLL